MELRQALGNIPDLVIIYVLPENQVNAKTLRFIDELGLREQVRFAVDPDSAAIDQLGVRLDSPEPIEEGVPHPTTYVLDREGIVRFADTRRDFHIWLDSQVVVSALEDIP